MPTKSDGVNLLAIDTSNTQCSVAIYKSLRLTQSSQPLDRKYLFAEKRDANKKHAQLILPLIDMVLEQAAMTKQQLDCIVYSKGPGTFTGVRIAASVVQAISFALNIPVIGISSLRAIAYRALADYGIDNCLVLIDARMAQFYCNHFTMRNGVLSADQEDYLLSVEQVEGLLNSNRLNDQKFSSEQTICLVPDSINPLSDKITTATIQQQQVKLVTPSLAEDLIIIGLQKYNLQEFEKLALPTYLRHQVATPQGNT